MGSLEAAFAHFTWTLTVSDLSDVEILTHERDARALLEGLGFYGDYFFQEGDEAYNRYPQPAYPVAWYWYRLSAIFQPLPEEVLYRVAILDIAFSGRKDAVNVINEEMIVPLGQRLILEPTQLLRFTDGTPVTVNEIDGKKAGMFYGRRDIGGVLLDVREETAYCITINALDRPPEPTHLEITLDLNELMLVELTEGDDKWKTFTQEVQLNPGLRLLGIRLANDAIVSGLDRNGHVGEIILQECQD